MKRQRFQTIAIAACLVSVTCLGAAVAQENREKPDQLPAAKGGALGVKKEATDASPEARMDEDIEIMREILRRALRAGTRGMVRAVSLADFDGDGDLDIHLANTFGGAMGQGVAVGDFDNDGWPDLYVANQEAGQANNLYRNDRMGRFTAVNGTGGLPQVEGTYVKGHGVVFQATLPESLWPKRGGAASAEGEQPAKLWDRIRGQLKGEKAATAQPADQPPEVDAVVLKLLAENGHNFSQLTAADKITVTLVFRKETPKQAGGVKGSGGGRMDGGMMGRGAGAGTGMMMPARAAGGAMGAAGDIAVGEGGGTGAPIGRVELAMPPDARNLEMLGDLHLKQGHAREAGAAFVKAHEIFASKELAAKALQAYGNAGDADSLRAAQAFLSKLTKQAEAAKALGKLGEALGTARVATSSKVGPRKLVITVSKDSVDQVAQGKLSYGDFVSKATIERR